MNPFAIIFMCFLTLLFGLFYKHLNHDNFYFPVSISLISAFIFWFLFSYLPYNTRYKKLRPILELNSTKIDKYIYHVFDNIFSHAPNQPSFYQEDILGKKITQEDIYQTLQNKCINDSYRIPKKYALLYRNRRCFIPNEFSLSYEAIGKDLQNRFRNIELVIDRILMLEQYATEEELILFEKIRDNIQGYLSWETINSTAVQKCPVKGIDEIVVPTNISHMSGRFYDLYELFHELKKLRLHDHKYQDENNEIEKIKYLYYMGEYDVCMKFLKKVDKKQHKSNDLIWAYKCLIKFKINELDSKELRFYLDNLKKKGRDFIVGHRHFYETLKENIKFKNIYSEIFTEEIIKSMESSLQKESETKRFYEKFNSQIDQFFLDTFPTIKNPPGGDNNFKMLLEIDLKENPNNLSFKF